MSTRPDVSRPLQQRFMAGVRRFFAWWAGELAALLPQSWRAGSADALDSVLLTVEGQTLSARVRQGERWVEVARRSLQGLDLAAQEQAAHGLLKSARVGGDRSLALAVPPTQVLRRDITLPLAAEDNLRTVLGYEIDHYTPFKPEQVYYDFRLVRRDPALGKLTVLLGVVPRAVVDQDVERLARWGIRVDAAVVLDDLQPRVPALNFLPEDLRPKRHLALGKTTWALIVLVLLLGAAALALPIAIERQASIRLIPVVAQADRATAEVERLRSAVQAAQARYNLLIQKKQNHPSAILLLDELTRLLPDDTWVQQLSLNGNTLQIQGDTGSASKLIGLIENSRILHGANFMAPLTKGSAENTEHYLLSAQVQPASLSVLATRPAPPPAPPASAAQPAAAASVANPPVSAASAPKPAASAAAAVRQERKPAATPRASGVAPRRALQAWE